MIRIMFVFLFALFLVNCKDKSPLTQERQDQRNISNIDDSDSAKTIRNFRFKESMAMDSISFYDLDSLNCEVLKYLYVIYGKEKLVDSIAKSHISIGELDFRVIGFTYLSKNRRMIDYYLFNLDSMPVSTDFDFKFSNRIMNSFEINIEKKSILEVSSWGSVRMSFDDFLKDFYYIQHTPDFITYFTENKKKLNPKFLRCWNR